MRTLLSLVSLSIVLAISCDSRGQAPAPSSDPRDSVPDPSGKTATPADSGAAQVPALRELTERLLATQQGQGEARDYDVEREKEGLKQQAKDFLGALLSSDPEIYAKYLLSEEEVKAYYGEERARILLFEARVQSHEGQRQALQELVGDRTVTIQDVKISEVGVDSPDGRTPFLATGRLELSFKVGMLTAELRFSGAVRTKQGWRFLHFVCARERTIKNEKK